MYKIFFNTAEILIVEEQKNKAGQCNMLLNINDLKSNFNRYTYAWKQLITPATICLTSPTPSEGFQEFASLFKNMEAAGGIVTNPYNKVLVIKRNGIWDLPKGKKEKGEDHKTTALREVNEETGITDLAINRFFDTTYHIYDTYGEWTLKTTYWFVMTSRSEEFTPQTEEGIEEVRYLSKTEIDRLKHKMYPLVYKLLMKFFHGEK